MTQVKDAGGFELAAMKGGASVETQGGSIDTCNMCGKKLTEFDRQESFGFEYYIGYGSKHDLEHVKARFCCDCFDRILDGLIAKCKISPVVGEYGFGRGMD